MRTWNVGWLVVGLSTCSARDRVPPAVGTSPPPVASTVRSLSTLPKANVEYLGHSPCMDTMGVRLEMLDGRPVVYVQHSCTEDRPALVHEISFLDYHGPQLELTEAGDLPKLAPPYCTLEANGIRSGHGDFPATGWEYGASLAGYTVLRACAPLPTGRRYYAMVIGSGVGGVAFEIRPDGGLEIFGDDCTP